MPKTREQIKHEPVRSEAWRNNRTQVGGLWFDPRKIRPLGDHVLIELEEATDKRATLELPDIARNKDIGTRFGTVLAVGPGKWHEKPGLSWELTRQYFKPTTLKVGQRVAIGHFSDWESWSADFEARDSNIVLCQEADVRVIIDGNPN